MEHPQHRLRMLHIVQDIPPKTLALTVCLLAKDSNNPLRDFRKAPRKHLMCVHLQLIILWNEPKLKWLITTKLTLVTKIGYDSVNHTDIHLMR